MVKNTLAVAVSALVFSGSALAEKTCPFCMSEAEQAAEQARASGEIVVDTSDRSPVPEYYPIQYGSVHDAGLVDPEYPVIYAGKIHLDHKTTHEIEKNGVKETIEAEGRHLFFAYKEIEWGSWGAVNGNYRKIAIPNPVDVVADRVLEAAKTQNLNEKEGLEGLRKNASPANPQWHDRVNDQIARAVQREVVFKKGEADVSAMAAGGVRRGADPVLDPLIAEGLMTVAAKGEHNTDVMMASEYDQFAAAAACRSMGPDWFLPSYVELSHFSDALTVAYGAGDITEAEFNQWRLGSKYEAVWTSNQVNAAAAFTVGINKDGSIAVMAGSKALRQPNSIGEYTNSHGNSSMPKESSYYATPHAIVCARH